MRFAAAMALGGLAACGGDTSRDVDELKAEVASLRAELASLRAELAKRDAQPPVAQPAVPSHNVDCDPYTYPRGCPPADPTPADVVPAVKIQIESSPPGADVVMLPDGKLVGKTPLSMTVPGSTTPRQFRLQLPGYNDLEVELVPDKDIAYRATLAKQKQGAPPKAKATRTGGELTGNPYEKRSSNDPPCDPFSNVHGCSK